jgi:protocatechuate 3,4-dioxygenase beta subunit
MDGHFLLKDVAPGRYQFFATRTGFVDQQYQSEDPDSGAVLALRPGKKVGDVLFRMTIAAAVTGRVIDENGEPVAGVLVSASRKLSEEEIEEEGPYASKKQRLTPAAAAQTDDRGHYRLFGLRPGEYYIRASDSPEFGFGRFQWRDMQVRESLGAFAPLYYPGVLQLDQAQMIRLRAGDEAQADFSMRHTKTVEISGQVIGPDGPGRNAWVYVESTEADGGGVGHQSNTDEQGKFSVRGVPSGSYYIVAHQKGEGDKYLRGRQKVEVGGDNVDSLIIALGGGATLRGRITVAGPGTVIMDRIHVALLPIEEGEQRSSSGGRVKRDGTFEITSVRDGSYRVDVYSLDENWYTKSVRIGQDDVLVKGVQVERGVAGGRLEIVLSSAKAQLEGSVTDHDKAVVGARIRVVAEPQTPYNGFRFRTVTTDQMGRFLLSGLAPGKYRVTAKSPVSSGREPLRSEAQIIELSEHDLKAVQMTLEAQEQ